MIPTLLHIVIIDIKCCCQYEKFAFRIEVGGGLVRYLK